MRIQFFGADRTVTGSCHLLEINGLRLLLDCGMYQGSRAEARTINESMPDAIPKVDAVILTHGHLDHCGKLPMLVRAGYTGPIYCTSATAEVTRIVLTDSAHIQEEDADYLNRRSRDPGTPLIHPLYTSDDIPATLKQLRQLKYGQKFDLGKGVSFTFYDAGHILGSAYVILEWTEANQPRKFLFTGDIGRYNTPILCDPTPLPGPVDLLITESTYGNALHGPMDAVAAQFLEAVKFVIQKRSRLLVPSFAIGRTQTVVWYMQKFIEEKSIPAIPIFVDSPMGVDASKTYANFPEYFDADTRARIGKGDLFGFSRVTFASSTQQSKSINSQQGPCVIVASSPTCEFGRILHHLTMSLERPDDLITFVGWTPPNTLGYRLQSGEKRVRVLDRWYDVKCNVRTIRGLSAHADGDELLRFLKPTLVPQTRAFVVHGEVPQAEAFAARLVDAGLGQADIPAKESSVAVFSAPLAPPNDPKSADADS